MKTHFLLPNRLKIFGWILFIPGLITAITLRLSSFSFSENMTLRVFAIYQDDSIFGDKFFSFVENGFLDEILILCIIIGGIIIGFSKLKKEDEYIAQIRYESLVWATYLNFGLLAFTTLFFFGSIYFDIMTLNIFSMLLFFVIRFHYMIYKLEKKHSDDE